MQDVTQFVVIAPASMGKAIQYAQDRIIQRLGRSFPDYRFQLEPFGPLADPERFSVVPVMGSAGEGNQVYMCRPLDPWVIPAIKDVLREFELSPRMQ